MKSEPNDELAETFADNAKVSDKVRQAVREALERHASQGDLVCIWRDGKPVWVRPPGATP